MRENTEQLETKRNGSDIHLIIGESIKILNCNGKDVVYPKLWDGHTGKRIAEIISCA